MLRTITLGSCVSVQGDYVKTLSDGRVAVKVDETVYAGVPINGSGGEGPVEKLIDTK